MTTSFWAIPDVSTIKTPLAILKEQAAALTDATRGLVRGEVETGSMDGQLLHTLNLVSPALGGFKYHVLSYKHPIILWPGSYWLPLRSEWVQVGDPDQFLTFLKSILSSDAIKGAIGGLLAQSQDASM